MKKITLITLFSIAVASIANTQFLPAIPGGAIPAAAAAPGPKRAGSLAHASSDPSATVQLPASITDPLLLAAWLRVYEQTGAIQPVGSLAVSGRSLAQFLRQQAIPVVWDTHNVCQGGSCSALICFGARCTFTDETPGVAPIYIARSQGDDPQSLTRTLAHEIYHRTQPFGRVHGTRYEEYWAFVVGVQVAQADWPTFLGYDPLDPLQLNLWIRENRLDAYFKLPEYPLAVAAQVVRAAGSSDPFSGIPAQAYAPSPSR